MKYWLLIPLSLLVRIAIPILVAALVVRYCVVYPGFAIEPLSRLAGQLNRRQPVFFLVGLTLLLSLLADRYWKIAVARFGWKAEVRYREPRTIWASAWWGTAAWIVVAGGLAWLLRAYLFEVHSVVGVSMLPTLEIGDEVLVNKAAYGWRHALNLPNAAPRSPRRGELVVFNFAGTDGAEQLLLKRVIGIAGDRIRMQGNVPIINGWRVPYCDVGPYANLVGEQFVAGRIVVEFLDEAAYLTLHTVANREPFEGEYVVQSGEIFVLGDHRSESIDSRAWNSGRGGGVPLGALVGRTDRFLIGVTQGGDWEFSRAFRPIQPVLAVDGIDASLLTTAIDKCLRTRPKDVSPPAASGVAVAQRN